MPMHEPADELSRMLQPVLLRVRVSTMLPTRRLLRLVRCGGDRYEPCRSTGGDQSCAGCGAGATASPSNDRAQQPQSKPEVTRDVKPDAAEPKPAAKPAPLSPPAVIAPKEIEIPAEPKAVPKPETKPDLAPPKPSAPPVPEKPPLVPPQATAPAPAAPPAAPPADGLPALKPPGKPDDAKPAAPKKPTDDPFGANSDGKSLRQWTDASGKYHIEARFVSYADGTVRLQKADGRYYRIKFDRLGAADRDFVLSQDGSLYAAE